jgi:hypothetical protein
MCFEEQLKEYQKLILTHFLKKSIYDFLELNRRYLSIIALSKVEICCEVLIIFSINNLIYL